MEVLQIPKNHNITPSGEHCSQNVGIISKTVFNQTLGNSRKDGWSYSNQIKKFRCFNTMDSIVLLIILDVKTYDENYLHK